MDEGISIKAGIFIASLLMIGITISYFIFKSITTEIAIENNIDVGYTFFIVDLMHGVFWILGGITILFFIHLYFYDKKYPNIRSCDGRRI